jgi:hypothetical protein
MLLTLSARPLSNLVGVGCWPATIFLEQVEQYPRLLQPPFRVTVDYHFIVRHDEPLGVTAMDPPAEGHLPTGGSVAWADGLGMHSRLRQR